MPGPHIVAIDVIIGPEARHGLQQRIPAIMVAVSADAVAFGQQQMVIDVEQPQRDARALHGAADPQEIMAFGAQHAGRHRPAKPRHIAANPVDQHRQFAHRPVRGQPFEPPPAVVERLPHFERQRGAHRAAIRPRPVETGPHGRGIVRVEQQDRHRVGLAHFAARLGIAFGGGDAQHGSPVIAGHPVGQHRQPPPHHQQPAGRVGALGIAGQPVEIIGSPAQHGALILPAPSCL